MTLRVTRVDWHDPRAVALRAAMDGESGARYAPLLEGLSRRELDGIDRALEVKPEDIVATILVLEGDEPVGHSALRQCGESLELKKVFVPVAHRGRGISRVLMLALEDIALGRGVGELVLQTGSLQTEAIALYEKVGYERIPAFGAYSTVPFAVCFRKML